MLDAAKNKMRVKICYLMIALTVIGCIAMIISGKKVRRGFSLSSVYVLHQKPRINKGLTLVFTL